MRTFALPTAIAPAWNRMKELRAQYATQPMRTMHQRFSVPLAWRKNGRTATTTATTTSNSNHNNNNSNTHTGSAKRQRSTRRSSTTNVPTRAAGAAAPTSNTSSTHSSSRANYALATRTALEASANISEFELLAVLGRGTFGVVKLARHVATGAAVAIKVLDKQLVVAMKQEKNILREQTVHLLLAHKFVAHMFATFQDSIAIYFVVEFCPGGELFSLVYDANDTADSEDSDSDEEAGDNQVDNVDVADRNAQQATVTTTNQDTNDDDGLTITSTTDSEWDDEYDNNDEQAAQRARAVVNTHAKLALQSPSFRGLAEPHAAFYLACLLVSLEHLHDLNILYRDVKLENLVLDADGYVKLIDFGLSKPDAARCTRNTTMCGSMEYMAPEVLQRLPYDHRADVWAFGIVMYELLLGATPFYDHNTREQAQRILTESVAFPTGFEAAHPAACGLLRQLLAKNPHDRPRSFANVRDSAFFTTYFGSPLAWTRLRTKQLPAPFVPQLDGPFDTSLFTKTATVSCGATVDCSTSNDDDELYSGF